MACSQTLLDLTYSSSTSLGTERSAMVDVQTLSSTSNNLFSSFVSSMLGVSSLGDESKETSLALSSFFWDGGILKMYLSLPWGGKRSQ